MALLSLYLSLLLSLSIHTTPREVNAGVSPAHTTLVIGFVGGFVRRDDRVHGPVQLAEKLRRDYPSSVNVQMYENRHMSEAHADIVRFLDSDHDGSLSAQEKRDARIVIYGHSWGGSAGIALARQLQKDGVPVLLTVQIDSVEKFGQNDEMIPPNVADAANFYQTDGLLHGETQIRAEDPAHTRILGNYRFQYKAHPIRCDQYPWYDRLFMKAHTEIECDPNVWARVEGLIRQELPESSRSALAE